MENQHAEKDLLNFIQAVASDAEELGFPQTALSLRRIVEERLAKKDGFSRVS